MNKTTRLLLFANLVHMLGNTPVLVVLFSLDECGPIFVYYSIDTYECDVDW